MVAWEFNFYMNSDRNWSKLQRRNDQLIDYLLTINSTCLHSSLTNNNVVPVQCEKRMLSPDHDDYSLLYYVSATNSLNLRINPN